MWPPRHTHQLEVTVNIAKKGCAVACIVCPQEKLSTTYNLYPDKDKLFLNKILLNKYQLFYKQDKYLIFFVN